MVDKIYNIKAKVLEHMEKAVGEQRMDTDEIGMLADVVKDLSEAEEKCWEAEYYKSVTKAMGEQSMGYEGGMGYDGNMMGYENNMGYDGQQGYRQGYRGRDSMGRYTSRRGYADRDTMMRPPNM